MDYQIRENENGTTLKQYLRGTLGLSHQMIVRLKQDEAGILVNGRHETVRYVLKNGDVLSLAVEDRQDGETVLPVKLPLEILYEDDSLIAVNKPPHMPTHPSPGHAVDTLANALQFYYNEKGIPFVFRCPSRLDRNTSGVVLVAKNAPSAAALAREHLGGTFEKTYLTFLQSCPNPPSGSIRYPIARVAGSIIKRCVSENGEAARTEYETRGIVGLANGQTGYLVKAVPVTGRTHQLRVHFAAISCPICDDTLYGEKDGFGIGRQALHAWKITVTHPVTGKRISFEAPLPDDMKEWIAEKYL